jgi:molybdopterin biosynthesis enzyme
LYTEKNKAITIMEEKKKEIPDFECIDFYTGDARLPEGLPKVKVVKRGNKTKDNDPIEVKRAMRPGFRRCKPGESINWREYYS